MTFVPWMSGIDAVSLLPRDVFSTANACCLSSGSSASSMMFLYELSVQSPTKSIRSDGTVHGAFPSICVLIASRQAATPSAIALSVIVSGRFPARRFMMRLTSPVLE